MPAVSGTFVASPIGRALDRPAAASGPVRVLAIGTIVAVPLIVLSLLNRSSMAWPSP